MSARKGRFVDNLSNVSRFLQGVKTVLERGAPEASWLLVKGEPGYGKTRTVEWFATQKPSVFLRAKAGWTSNWMLHDFAQALGVKPFNNSRDLFNAVLAEIMRQQDTRDDFCMVVDEFDHAARTIKVAETLRDLTDFSEVPLIVGGMKGIDGQLKRHPQIFSRVTKVVEFGPATVGDVRAMFDARSDVKVADDMVAEVHRRTQGRLRSVMQAVAFVDAYGRKAREKVTVESFGKRPLLNDERGGDD